MSNSEEIGHENIIFEKEKNKNNNLERWCIANIILFLVSIKLFDLGINTFKYLTNANEYTIGIEMIFLVPIVVFLFGIFVTGLGITALVFESISIKKILTGDVTKIFKIIVLFEIFGYVCFIIYEILRW